MAAVALAPCAAMPGPTASPGPSATKRAARSSIVSTGRPTCAETVSGPYAWRRSAYGPASPPSRAMTFAMARATRASAPGATGTHSSAFWPVSESRGPMNTKGLLPPPSSAALALAKPRVCSTGEIHEPRKSAPKEKTIPAEGKSKVGMAFEPKTIRAASLSGASDAASYSIRCPPVPAISPASRRASVGPACRLTSATDGAASRTPARRRLSASSQGIGSCPSAPRSIGEVSRSGSYRPWSADCPRAQSAPPDMGWFGLPSSLMARPSRVLTQTPQPEEHSPQTVEYQVATPGVISSGAVT